MKICLEIGGSGWFDGKTLIALDVPFAVSNGRGADIILRNTKRLQYIHRGDPKYLTRVGLLGTDDKFTEFKVLCMSSFPILLVDGQEFTLDTMEFRTHLEADNLVSPTVPVLAGELRLI